MTNTEDGYYNPTSALEEMRNAAHDHDIAGLVRAASGARRDALAMEYFHDHLRRALIPYIGRLRAIEDPVVQSAVHGALNAHWWNMPDEAQEIRQWLTYQNLPGNHSHLPGVESPALTPEQTLDWAVAVQVHYDDKCTRVPHLADLLGVTLAGTESTENALFGRTSYKYLSPVGSKAKLLAFAWQASRCGGTPRVFHPGIARTGGIPASKYSRDKPIHAQPHAFSVIRVALEISSVARRAKGRLRAINDRWNLNLQPPPKPEDEYPF